MRTIVPPDRQHRVERVPLDCSGRDRPRQLILVLLPALVVQMDLIRCRDGDCWVYRHIWYCNSDDLLVIAFQLADLGLWEKAHANLNTNANKKMQILKNETLIQISWIIIYFSYYYFIILNH